MKSRNHFTTVLIDQLKTHSHSHAKLISTAIIDLMVYAEDGGFHTAVIVGPDGGTARATLIDRKGPRRFEFLQPADRLQVGRWQSDEELTRAAGAPSLASSVVPGTRRKRSLTPAERARLKG